MKGHYKVDPWKIIEEGFEPLHQEASESLFSIGNGRFGQRANFEENYSGSTLQGSYIGGIYYPDKTLVGWWKNGYPEYFAKVLNAPNWIGISIEVDGEEIDLAQNKVIEFERILDMRNGVLQRNFIVEINNGNQIQVNSTRFCSLTSDSIGAIRYNIKPLNFSGNFNVSPYIDADVKNEDSNYDEKFWDVTQSEIKPHFGFIKSTTKKSAFVVNTGMMCNILLDGLQLEIEPETVKKEAYIANKFDFYGTEGSEISVLKFATYTTSFNHDQKDLNYETEEVLKSAVSKGFTNLLEEHQKAWQALWQFGDIKIEGDDAAQQAIRFNIFHLHQTYTGKDERLNIGPKGFTGEKYGGSTYWDTEAYCLQFYLSTAGEKVAENLLQYRHNQLDKAIENATKLGFKNCAALYPMVTINGEECHNEWEITFEEIHRNGAIAFAIYNYTNYTGKTAYRDGNGIEILLAISRFWAQRVNWSTAKEKYVLLGVTGPNEYENNVNNNWYTNYLACWTLRYTAEVLNDLKKTNPNRISKLVEEHNLNFDSETTFWKRIIDNMYYPVDEKTGVLLQQEGFLDKELVPISELNTSERPINQHWSWDRILRSAYIKQGDVIQGLYFFEHEFSKEEIKRNFDFYEQFTVHESSLSPCIHSILACSIGSIERAYEHYLATARLDLDDYNKEVHEGLHITSMAGTWKSIVEGFGGMRYKNDCLSFNPTLPKQWSALTFNVLYRGQQIKFNCSSSLITITNMGSEKVNISLLNEMFVLQPSKSQKKEL